MAKSGGLAKILAIIGGLIVFITGILALLGVILASFSLPFNIPGGGGIWGGLGGLINAIIEIVIGALILISTGVLKSDKSVKFNGVTILVLGILAIIFGSFIGAVLVIIAGILMLL